MGVRKPEGSHSSVIKDSSCLGSDTLRFMKFSQSQDVAFHVLPSLHTAGIPGNYLYVHSQVFTLSDRKTKACNVVWDSVKPWAQTSSTCPSW